MEYKGRLNLYKLSVPDLRLYFSVKLKDVSPRQFFPYLGKDVVVNIKQTYDRRNTSQNRRLWEIINKISLLERKTPSAVYEDLLMKSNIWKSIYIENLTLEEADLVVKGWERGDVSGYKADYIRSDDTPHMVDLMLHCGSSQLSKEEFDELLDEAMLRLEELETQKPNLDIEMGDADNE
jgi:hypothetical protein